MYYVSFDVTWEAARLARLFELKSRRFDATAACKGCVFMLIACCLANQKWSDLRRFLREAQLFAGCCFCGKLNCDIVLRTGYSATQRASYGNEHIFKKLMHV